MDKNKSFPPSAYQVRTVRLIIRRKKKIIKECIDLNKTSRVHNSYGLSKRKFKFSVVVYKSDTIN